MRHQEFTLATCSQSALQPRSKNATLAGGVFVCGNDVNANGVNAKRTDMDRRTFLNAASTLLALPTALAAPVACAAQRASRTSDQVQAPKRDYVDFGYVADPVTGGVIDLGKLPD